MLKYMYYLLGNMNIITVVPHDGLRSRIIKDVRDVYRDEAKNKICYITLNKPHTSLLEHLIEEKANISRWYFIDAITSTVVKNPKGPSNCAFVSSPTAFSEVLAKVDELLGSDEFGAMVFDSVCTLISFGHSETMDFLKKLSTRVSVANCEGVFMAFRTNINQENLNRLYAVADKIVDLDST